MVLAFMQRICKWVSYECARKKTPSVVTFNADAHNFFAVRLFSFSLSLYIYGACWMWEWIFYLLNKWKLFIFLVFSECQLKLNGKFNSWNLTGIESKINFHSTSFLHFSQQFKLFQSGSNPKIAISLMKLGVIF